MGLTFTAQAEIPDWLDNRQTIEQLQEWEREYPDYVDAYTIGNTLHNLPICAIRLTNENSTQEKKVVLITACIHGNEPLASSVVMGYVSTVLENKDSHSYLADMLDHREIWVVPVVSPDSYPNSREIEGVDPNRNFNENPSVTPIEVLKHFATRIQPDAVISGHTHGRIMLYPFGESNNLCPHDQQYRQLLDRLNTYNNYRVIRGCEMYGHPIYGTEVDWYYKELGAFATVFEFGTHQHVPSRQDIREECNRSVYSMILFTIYAPEAF